MANISKHSKERMIERISEITNIPDAKRMAKAARASGKLIGAYKNYPRFFTYLQKKKDKSTNNSVRVYRNCVYIWKGSKNKTLVTVFPIPERFLKEMEETK